MNSGFLRLAMISLLCGSTLTACGEKTPKGQVLAVVNGNEVTRRDLSGEAGAAGAGEDAAPALLSGVIDRKLAAAEAQRLELDKTPQFTAQANRLQEVMLSRTLFDRWANEMPQPSKQAISEYIRANPQQFDNRKLFLVDRISTEAGAISKEKLLPLQTNDDVSAALNGQKRPFQRAKTVVDSATLQPALFRQMNSIAPGYPLAITQNGELVILAVLEARDAPLPVDQREAAAIASARKAFVQQKLSALRKSAKITYQPGFRPT